MMASTIPMCRYLMILFVDGIASYTTYNGNMYFLWTEFFIGRASNHLISQIDSISLANFLIPTISEGFTK
jgi:hypothetical protein